MLTLIALTLAVFAYAAYTDIRERRVPDWVWAVYAAMGTPLLLLGGADIQSVLLSVGVVGTAALVSRRFGGLGGADVKGLLILSVLLYRYAIWAVIAGSFVALAMSRRYGDNNPFMVSLLIGIVLALVFGGLGLLPR